MWFFETKKRKNILWSSFRCYLLLIDRCLLLLFFLYHWTYDPSAPLTVSGDGHTRHPDSLLHDPTPCGHTHDSATEELGGSRPRANQCSTTPERSTAHKSTSGWQSWLVTVLKVGCMLYTKNINDFEFGVSLKIKFWYSSLPNALWCWIWSWEFTGYMYFEK